ncbi:MTH1187 family thiamine-binding protein [bacterium]|nr:MTH1187 family thiamine-binding protein [candidate division CSSED10-310 bacterium]
MLCEFRTSPFGSSESVSRDVAEVIELIESSGLPSQTHAMGTIVEGEWDEIMDLIRRCHALLRENHRRVITDIHIDDRENARNRLAGKVNALEAHLGRKIRR